MENIFNPQHEGESDSPVCVADAAFSDRSVENHSPATCQDDNNGK